MNKNCPKPILIVDDSKDHQILLKMFLESRGYKVDCTSNGEEALVLLRSAQVLPQTILLDLRMPVMDGIDFRNRQREDPLLKDIPVVIMSGDEDTEQIKIKTGSEVLKKPVSLSSVLETLERNSSPIIN